MCRLSISGSIYIDEFTFRRSVELSVPWFLTPSRCLPQGRCWYIGTSHLWIATRASNSPPSILHSYHVTQTGHVTPQPHNNATEEDTTKVSKTMARTILPISWRQIHQYRKLISFTNIFDDCGVWEFLRNSCYSEEKQMRYMKYKFTKS